MANAGFAYERQVVDVGDFMGKGELETTSHYYQNLGEAEACALSLSLFLSFFFF